MPGTGKYEVITYRPDGEAEDVRVVCLKAVSLGVR